MAPPTLLTFLLTLILLSSNPTLSLNVNVSKVLTTQTQTTESFKIAVGLLSKLKIDIKFQADSPFTLFMPADAADAAFDKLPPSVLSKLKSLSDNELYKLMEAHIVRGYFTPFKLCSKNHTLFTLTTEAMGHFKFMLNVSSSSASALTIKTGLVQAVVDRTMYLHSPLAIYSVSKVLLPTEIFGKTSCVPPFKGFIH